MWKKMGSILLAVFILATFSVSAYAGQTDSNNNSTQTAINSGAQQNLTGGAIKGSTPSKSAISGDATATSESAVASGSSITSGSSVTSESAVASKNAIEARKSEFGLVIGDVLKEGTAITNEYFNMTITNPEKDKESTYYKSYVLSGNSKYDDVVISIAKFNEEKGVYEPMLNTDGESSWDIGEFRLFSKEITLTEGTNQIMMIAYRTSQEAVRKNIQFNSFTIKLLNESIIKKVIRKTTDIFKLTEIFPNKTK